MAARDIQIRQLGLVDYTPMFEFMQRWSDARDAETPDELWLLEHPAVYTLGRIAKPEHLLNVSDIPVVQVDRGGQVTYHGPGQLVVYLMLDVRRGRWGVRQIVTAMENTVVRVLAEYGLVAYADKDAPGVYIDKKKISALGLRVRNGKSYHGLSLNLDMDLRPFQGINPCGYQGLEVIRLTDLVDYDRKILEQRLVELLCEELEFANHHWMPAMTFEELKNEQD